MASTRNVLSGQLRRQDLSSSDLALQKRSRREQMQWELRMRAADCRWALRADTAPAWATNLGHGDSGFTIPGSGLSRALTAAVEFPLSLAREFGGALSTIQIPHFDFSSPAFRRIALIVAGVSITGVALATTAITKGYIDHPEAFWKERISERTQSPIIGRDKTLVGSVGAQQSKLTPDQAREYAYIPLQGDLPPIYVAGLLAMENKSYLTGGFHNICGLDVPATLKRWIVNRGSGGSTLSMQLARQLKEPEWGHESNVLQKVWRKGLEIGASCRLYKTLAREGGDTELLKLYASYAPTMQGNGSLRGIEAASRIIFDIAPQALTDGQQLLLAAAARKPLTLLPPGAIDIECKRVYPPDDNPLYERETAKANAARSVQCQVTHRAIYWAPYVLDGKRLETAIKELRVYQAKGVHPANPFEPIPAKRLVNLASRTAVAMPTGLLAQIQKEADEGSIVPGEPLYVTLDAGKQHAFQKAFTEALDQIQRTPYMRKTLCLRLVYNKEKPLSMPVCAPHDEVQSADVLAAKVEVASGGLQALYSSAPLLMASNQSIGSLAKWIVIVAALAEGYQPGDLFCPKAARDRDRHLKRAAAPQYGFERCARGNLLKLERAVATSDNLVFFQLAQVLRVPRLIAAATALGLGEPARSENLAYEVSFGSYGARPRDLISAFQALVAVAYGIKITGHAPRVLSNAGDEVNPASTALKKLLPRQAQRDALRQLLEAPVQSPGGTLAFLKTQVTAGKTGTVQSAVKARNDRNFNHGKWSMTYQHDKRALILFYVASPLPTVPFAQHYVSASALLPAHLKILNQE